ncbi:MAG: biotin--[acetyl-CoA-carboxylase] ligase [Streptomycetaceae bacterium]|nr:MAG: biotin--[acetyl-CoA-carboxylase] ligase [Streptomycetaceae bacterium]
MDGLIEAITKVLNFSRSCMQITVHTPTVLVVSNLRAPLNQERINSHLADSYWRVSVVDVTGSTQRDLVNSVRASNSLAGEVLTAEYQSQGKGRLDRTFEAAPLSALLFSFFVQPKVNAERFSWLPLLAGLAVVNALDKCCTFTNGNRAQLKWPNDVLIGESKVAGIIAESADNKGVVIGIGLNVGMNLSELPVDHATSLELEGCSNCNRNELLVAILQEFHTLMKRFEESDLTLKDEYVARCATVHSEIRVEYPSGEIIDSFATGIDSTGELILENGRKVSAGDVVHLRAR